MSFIKESEITKKPNILLKFLIGPWNTDASFEFAVGKLEPGQISSYHFHERVEEALYVISGILEVKIDGQVTEMASGTALYIKPGLKHTVKAKTNVELVAIKNPSDGNDKHEVI